MSGLKAVTIWGSPRNNGDGSVSIIWFLQQSDADRHASGEGDKYWEGWGENCTFPVETFVGSGVYNEAYKNYETYCSDFGFEL